MSWLWTTKERPCPLPDQPVQTLNLPVTRMELIGNLPQPRPDKHQQLVDLLNEFGVQLGRIESRFDGLDNRLLGIEKTIANRADELHEQITGLAGV